MRKITRGEELLRRELGYMRRGAHNYRNGGHTPLIENEWAELASYAEADLARGRPFPAGDITIDEGIWLRLLPAGRSMLAHLDTLHAQSWEMLRRRRAKAAVKLREEQERAAAQRVVAYGWKGKRWVSGVEYATAIQWHTECLANGFLPSGEYDEDTGHMVWHMVDASKFGATNSLFAETFAARRRRK